MAIAAVTPVAVFSGTSSPGTSGPFALSTDDGPITFSLNSHIKVYRYDTTSDTAPVLLVENTDYTLTGGPDAGSLTLTSPQTPLLTGEKLRVYREQPVSQSLDLASGADFSATAVEARLDRLTEMVAENRRDIGQAVRFTTFATDGIPAYPIGAVLGKVPYLTGTEATPVWASYSFDPADLALVADALTAINLVAADLGGADTIGIVASISADVTTVAGIAPDVSIVAANMAAVLIVSAAIDDDLVYTQVETDALLDGKADKNLANTFTEGQLITLAGSDTEDALTITVGGTSDLRTTVASTGYVGAGSNIYVSPDGTGDASIAAIAGRSIAQNGTRGIMVGVSGYAEVSTSWAKGAGSEAGVIGGQFTAYSTKAGAVFGINANVDAITTAGALARGAEIDLNCTANAASKIGIELVSTSTDTGTTSGTVTIDGGNTMPDEAWMRWGAVSTGVGFAVGISAVKPSGGSQPLKATGQFLRVGGYTLDSVIDARDLTATTGVILVANAAVAVAARNAANSAFVNLLSLNSSNTTVLAAGSVNITSGGLMGVGTASPTSGFKGDFRGRIKVGSGDSSGDAEVRWSNYADTNVAYLASVRQDVGTATNSLKFLRFSGGSFADVPVEIGVTGGLFCGSPTGGDKGTGYINAVGVYDDNVLLSCYPFDAFLDGEVSLEKWDSKVPDREHDLLEEDPENEGQFLKTGTRIERREHIGARKFAQRLGGKHDPLTLDGYALHWKEKRHLTAFPNEARFRHGDMTSGEWIQRLIETAETQAILIEQLNQRLKQAGL